MQQKCTLFPERLTELREKECMSRQQLADVLGVSRASLEYYEKGKRTPDIEVLFKLSEHFNVTADYLMGRTDKCGESTDENAVCEYTGLSENAIKALHILKIESVQGYIGSDIEIKELSELIQKKFIEDEEMINSTKRDNKELLDLLSKLIEDGKHNIFDVIIALNLYLKKLDSDLRLYNFINENAETKMKENIDSFCETLGLLGSCSDKRKYMLFCINREFQNVIDLLSDEKEKRIEELERELLNKVDTFAHLEGDINGND